MAHGSHSLGIRAERAITMACRVLTKYSPWPAEYSPSTRRFRYEIARPIRLPPRPPAIDSRLSAVRRTQLTVGILAPCVHGAVGKDRCSMQIAARNEVHLQHGKVRTRQYHHYRRH